METGLGMEQRGQILRKTCLQKLLPLCHLRDVPGFWVSTCARFLTCAPCSCTRSCRSPLPGSPPSPCHLLNSYSCFNTQCRFPRKFSLTPGGAQPSLWAPPASISPFSLVLALWGWECLGLALHFSQRGYLQDRGLPWVQNHWALEPSTEQRRP